MRGRKDTSATKDSEPMSSISSPKRKRRASKVLAS